MKAYPLIYSRTKNFDFVPDFIVRPRDLDYRTALKYVASAMFELDFVDGIRYSAFSVGDYYICGGIGCLSKNLFALIQKTNITLPSGETLDSVKDYLSDCSGRKLACYIGIAIPQSEVKQGVIPDLSLEKYWYIYIEYLRHQWNSLEETSSEKLDSPPPIEINEKTYTSSFIPVQKQIGERYIIDESYYLNHQQEIIDYAFHQLLSGKDYSLITEVSKLNHWNQTVFKSASVSAELYSSIQNTKNVASTSNSSKSLLRPTDAPSANDGPQIRKSTFVNTDSAAAQKKTVSSTDIPEQSDRPSKNLRSLPLIVLAAIVVLIILILLLK